MAEPEQTVFVSYRRSVSSFIARAIFMDLRAHGYDVFMDVDSIDGGTFDTIILNQIAARAHFLVILTPGTLERCDEPGDWLRREIEYAMGLQRNIVPVLVGDFSFKANERHLTAKLADLPRYNALILTHEFFDAAMERLRIRFLKTPVYPAITPAPREDDSAILRRITTLTSQAAPTPRELSAEEYFLQALAAGAAGNYDGEINGYTAALQLNPNYLAAYTNRGEVRADTGDLDGAISDYGHVIRLKPRSAEAYRCRGAVRADKGDLTGAIDDFTMAITLDPLCADVYKQRGLIFEDRGDYGSAIADLEQYLNMGGPRRSRERAAIQHKIEDLRQRIVRH